MHFRPQKDFNTENLTTYGCHSSLLYVKNGWQRIALQKPHTCSYVIRSYHGSLSWGPRHSLSALWSGRSLLTHCSHTSRSSLRSLRSLRTNQSWHTLSTSWARWTWTSAERNCQPWSTSNCFYSTLACCSQVVAFLNTTGEVDGRAGTTFRERNQHTVISCFRI